MGGARSGKKGADLYIKVPCKIKIIYSGNNNQRFGYQRNNSGYRKRKRRICSLYRRKGRKRK
jgi:hypothetical protein